MKAFIFLLFVFTSISANAQLHQYDVMKEIGATGDKAKLVYMNAVWCKPCMDKLPSVIQNFGNREDIELIILMDQIGMSDKIYAKLKTVYDTSFMRLIPDKYYISSGGMIKIQINGSNKVIKNLFSDYNNLYTPALKSWKDLWFGHAIIASEKGIYITKEFDGEKLIPEIKKQIDSNPVLK